MKILCLMLLLLLCGCSAESGKEAVSMENGSVIAATEIMEPTETETSAVEQPELLNRLINPKDEDFVRVKDYVPEILTELKYASSDNFTGQVIYEFEDVFLRYGTVMKLKAVSEELAKQQLYLKIWDGFRPVSAQFKLWEICPDDTYVANPNIGYSNHSRGFAVDVTLVDVNGDEVEMPTGFDDFSGRADRDYSECTIEQTKNAKLLESVMEKHGFLGYWGEWWHFNDSQKYEVETVFDPGIISQQHTKEVCVLLDSLSEDGNVILEIPAGEGITVLGFCNEYALVEYWGYRGCIDTKNLME